MFCCPTLKAKIRLLDTNFCCQLLKRVAYYLKSTSIIQNRNTSHTKLIPLFCCEDQIMMHNFEHVVYDPKSTPTTQNLQLSNATLNQVLLLHDFNSLCMPCFGPCSLTCSTMFMYFKVLGAVMEASEYSWRPLGDLLRALGAPLRPLEASWRPLESVLCLPEGVLEASGARSSRNSHFLWIHRRARS